MNPKISIVTISYNCESEIEDTILSIIHQTYPNKEFLVIDGGSTDGTMAIVDKYKDKIDVIVSEPDKGRSDAFNKGIARAKGDYIVMMNAGDLMADDALIKFARSLVPGYDVIKGNTIRWNDKSNYKSVEYPVIEYKEIPFQFQVCHQSSFISKAAYEKYGVYDTSMHVTMDFELMLRFTRRGAKFLRIEEDLAIFRMGGISQLSKKRRLSEMKYSMQKNGHGIISTEIFLFYIRFRTVIREFLDLLNPDIKNFLISKKSKKINQ